jgi:hypothetical protein
MANLNWSASETEKVEPFRTSPFALESTRFRLTEDEKFDDRDLILIESEADWRDARPEIIVDFDTTNGSQESGVPEEELAVALVIRDRILNSFKLIERWDARDMPIQPIQLKGALSLFSHSRLLDVCAYLFPSITKDRGDGIASDTGQVLAHKVFKIRLHEQRSKFPKRWATPEEFEEQGLPRDTVYWIEWLVDDLNHHPSEAFRVWLNVQYKDQITSFDVGSKAGDLLKLNLAASILTELAIAVFSDTEQELNEPTGTIAIVTEELNEVTGKSFDEMRALVTSDHGGYSRVRAWAHEKLGVSSALGRLDFLR